MEYRLSLCTVIACISSFRSLYVVDVGRATRDASAEEPGAGRAARVRLDRRAVGRRRARRAGDATLSTVCLL